VPSAKETITELSSWLTNGFSSPLLFGGQIGSGKSTVIQKSFLDNGITPDIVIHFDQEGMNLSTGDFWRITLSGFIKAALDSSLDLSFCELPKELSFLDKNDWHGLLKKLAPIDFSMASFKEKENLSKAIARSEDYIQFVVKEIGQRINERRMQPLLIFASGIDKYNPNKTAYFSLESVFNVLVQFKTLFEVNAVHLFKASQVLSHLDKVILTVLDETSVMNILKKRMGIYANSIETELPLLAKWSAGNPRQAIRLLTNFEVARKKRNLSNSEILAQSIKATTRDFFGYSAKPSSELMNFLRTKNEIKSSLVSVPNDKDTARHAIYGNWIFITDQSTGESWPIVINPLVKASFTWPNYPSEPEVRALQAYAELHDISPVGLSFNLNSTPHVRSGSSGMNGTSGSSGTARLTDASGSSDTAGTNGTSGSSGLSRTKTGEELLQNILDSNGEKPVALNLTEILDAISSALLSKDRADRVIIAYKNDEILKAARSYLFAKANTYKYQRYKHFELKGGQKQKPLRTLDLCLSEDTDIFSFHFSGSWTEEQLTAIDKVRDRLIDYQIIWWIHEDDLKQYLPYWTQLRQLFEVFILEDEMLNSISIAEIESDLAFLKDLVSKSESSEANFVNNMKVVLKYLKKTQEYAKYE
jgi:hypothetical protein